MRTKLVIFCALCAVLAPIPGWGQYEVTVLPSGPLPYSFAYGIAGGSPVGSSFIPGRGIEHAMLWLGSSGEYVDLHPSGWEMSRALGASGDQQVGGGLGPGGLNALLWRGTAESYVNLHPTGVFDASVAEATDGKQQVGYAATRSGTAKAILWEGTAESYVNLNPAGFTSSIAFGVAGGQQVGHAASPNGRRAIIWFGSPEGYVDLTPSGILNARAYSTTGIQQAGHGRTKSTLKNHALIWYGSAESYVDLHPDIFSNTWAYATNGSQQAGWGVLDGAYNALAWSNSADSFVNLQQYLPKEFTGSTATGIDEFGNVAGYAWPSRGMGYSKAIMWTPVPEPSTLLALTFALCALAATRRRKGG